MLIYYFLDERKKQGLTETEFGRLAFPELENPRAKINGFTKSKQEQVKIFASDGVIIALCVKPLAKIHRKNSSGYGILWIMNDAKFCEKHFSIKTDK